jgi:ketosteroid isomerase-like protein
MNMLKSLNTWVLALCLTLPGTVLAGHHGPKGMAPEEVVAAAYATFATGDTQAWSALHTDDLTFTIFGQLPQSGVFIGQAAVIENVFAQIAVLWPEFTLTPINIDVIGNTVYVHNKMTAAGLDSETMHMFRLRDGKIVSFTAFEDTDSMRQAMVAE